MECRTYVFLDLETTSLPKLEHNRTRITELSLVAVKRNHVLETVSGSTPRIQHKLTFCLNPRKIIAPGCTEVTGLNNELLEYEPDFKEVFTTINSFLNVLERPVCLIAQNGYLFDFPILKNHLMKINVNLSSQLRCADCLHGFYDIMEREKKEGEINITKQTDKLEASRDMQFINETSPQRPIINAVVCPSPLSKVRRRFPWNDEEKPKDKYKLKHIYERLFQKQAVDLHRAENDCLITLKCFVALSSEMVQCVDNNHCMFGEIKPMVPGVPIGF